MFLWRRLATWQWWNDHEETLRAKFGDQLAVIERPGRKRLQIEIVCASPVPVRKFGGRIEKLPRDWLERFLRLQKTKPLKIGNRHLIIPAGAAFGTGDHATTALSLRMLERLTRNWQPGWSLVDLGTGSGILALAGRCLGAKRAIGIDIDPTAISTAKENARRNRIERVKFQTADVRHWRIPPKVDILTANLFSELLIEILPKLRRSRWLILSGVLREHEREVSRGLKRHKIDIVNVRRRGKWLAIVAKN